MGNGMPGWHFRNIETGEEVNHIPDGVVVCGGGGNHHAIGWQTTSIIDRTSTPAWNGRGFEGERIGSFSARDSCNIDQTCGLRDVGTCHDCDTEQECKDLGISSTLFVTPHREHMGQLVWN